MKLFLHNMASLAALLASAASALAVGECSGNAFGDSSSTPCCIDTPMAAGGSCYAPADSAFSFTIRSIGFEKQDGSIVTLGTNKSFNAAGADAGNVIGDFISGVTLPAGTYVAVRTNVSLAATTSNSAVVTPDSRTCSAGSVTGLFEQPNGGFPVCASDEPNAATDSCVDPADHTTFKYRNTQIGTFAYDGSSPLSVAFTFKTGNGVNCTFAPGSGGTQSSKAPGLLIVDIARN